MQAGGPCEGSHVLESSDLHLLIPSSDRCYPSTLLKRRHSRKKNGVSENTLRKTFRKLGCRLLVCYAFFFPASAFGTLKTPRSAKSALRRE
ncbi:uncharacterized protein K441DRAFT_297921 [Cenococcum geophilum 1.58]|uniref:uncharacterized protein n=1 Tax=Cenococcum geophilum 1.58 TaxID=794803 RepID=UPI00358F4C53|nr:hypothetical protein K441DRAFT_297921 [Cenococcum geophilum 1.58]